MALPHRTNGQADIAGSISGSLLGITELNAQLGRFIQRGDTVALDEGSFSVELRPLVSTLNGLITQYGGLKRFALDLAEGRLTGEPPARDNWLAGPLKSLHSQLLHLSWQAQQVAQGDYHQVVDFMGDFSEAFNTMIDQLSKREKQLVRGQETLVTVLEHTPYGVVVMDCDSNEMLYRNKVGQEMLTPARHAGCTETECTVLNALLGYKGQGIEVEGMTVWEVVCERRPLHLSVRTGRIDWDRQEAFLHILQDVTEEKREEQKLRAIAYDDQSTGVGNRNGGLVYLSEQLSRQTPFTALFLDMDRLKYINDTFGHVEGDVALRELAQSLRNAVRSDDRVFRMGGDEFLVVMHSTEDDAAERVLARVRQILAHRSESLPYSIEFSAGIFKNDGLERLTVEDLIQKVDELMYVEKRTKKHSR